MMHETEVINTKVICWQPGFEPLELVRDLWRDALCSHALPSLSTESWSHYGAV